MKKQAELSDIIQTTRKAHAYTAIDEDTFAVVSGHVGMYMERERERERNAQARRRCRKTKTPLHKVLVEKEKKCLKLLSSFLACTVNGCANKNSS